MTNPNSPMFVADAALVRRALEELLKLRAQGQMTEPQLRKYFLSTTIGDGWYDCLSEGMDYDTGHLLYRLTDFIDPEERASIQLYPGETDWLTVEDWRRDWERENPQGIPELPANELEPIRRALTV